MRRSPIYPFVVALGLVTAVALLRLGEVLTTGPLTSQVAGGNGDSALVRGFYDAVNATVESGHTADLDRLLAADFIDHGGSPGHPTTRDGFVRRLVALHSIYPTMRLAAHDLLVRGDVVVAHVRVDAATRGTFLNLPLPDQSAPWGAVDVFRIASGRIAEHWGGGQAVPFLASLQQASLIVPSSALQTVSVARTTVAPGSSVAVSTLAGPEAIYLENGQLAVEVLQGALAWRSPPGGAGAPALVEPGIETTLTPGGLVLLPEGSRATIRNDDGAPITYLVVAVRKPGGSTGSGQTVVPGAHNPAVTAIDNPAVTATWLAGALLTTLPGGPAVLGLGRATIAPGGVFPVATPGAALFVVEAGDLSLARTNGTVLSRRAADGFSTTATDGTFRPGDAVTIGPGASCDLRNAGTTPLVLLAVTITPVDPAAA